MPAQSVTELTAVKQLGPDTFESVLSPEAQGNAQAIAYGGCALGVACMAAHQGIPERHRIYSLTGHYLGPALIDRVFSIHVTLLRSTRTFTTKLVRLGQKQDDGSERACVVALVDFHAIEPESLMVYSTPPPAEYSEGGPEACPSIQTWREEQVKQGRMTRRAADMHSVVFGLSMRLFDVRPHPESMGAQNMYGLADTEKGKGTTQDGKPLYERTTGDWWRSKTQLRTRAEHSATLALQMDRAISFIPLTHEGKWLGEAGAVSSLDFSLRFMANDFDVNNWHLSVVQAVAGDAGRTYGESRMWNEQGKMVASMTQTCILRPKKKKSVKL